ncbi:hypothetical protein [Parasaccharibacter sp. TMW2.1890]|uniref:hypothetical protein n=1 Tax=Parasaccharibacter sp. TMW2.1890 TaxID=2039289 RepID=UPI002013B40D|nr:hypothetical protein [Parasaccharibacter sp. TMW2.1890]MCL1515212.1 hypothetical protein [Parasaccharibacter sp. TMW2.1890]
MPSLDEITRTTGTPLANALAAGLGDISYGQTVRFTRYQRTVLPVDGFVFWVSTGETQDVQGAIHVTTGNELTEDQAYDQSSIVLTTKTEVHPFHDLALDTIWIGDFEGVRFAISSRSSRYSQAGLFHYLGSTVTPAFQSQFIDSASMLQKMEPVTSSSLALFLALPMLGSVALDWCPWPSGVPVFPSFAVPDNQPPPYVAVHNAPDGGRAVSMGTLDPRRILHWALLNDDRLGIINSPHIRDEKQASAEINALAMSKTIELDVMYSQTALRDTALQLIRHVTPTLTRSS